MPAEPSCVFKKELVRALNEYRRATSECGREGQRFVARHGGIITTVVLEIQSRAAQARNRSTDCESYGSEK
jgi:hypothetical protein